MMLLCPSHHDAATHNAMSIAAQRRYKAAPHNIQAGLAHGQLSTSQNYAAIAIGQSALVGDGAFFAIDGEELLRIGLDDNGEILLSASLKDRDGREIATIVDNEWLSGDPSVWDMTSSWGRLKIWTGSRKIAFELVSRFHPVTVRADLWHNGACMRLGKDGISFFAPGSVLANPSLPDVGLAGMGVNLNTEVKKFSLDAYEGLGLIVGSDGDVRERVQKTVHAWNKLKHPAFFRESE